MRFPSRVLMSKFSPPPAPVGERRVADAFPFASAPRGRSRQRIKRPIVHVPDGADTPDYTDVTDLVRLARRLSVPADDAIRQFIDRVVQTSETRFQWLSTAQA